MACTIQFAVVRAVHGAIGAHHSRAICAAYRDQLRERRGRISHGVRHWHRNISRPTGRSSMVVMWRPRDMVRGPTIQIMRLRFAVVALAAVWRAEVASTLAAASAPRLPRSTSELAHLRHGLVRVVHVQLRIMLQGDVARRELVLRHAHIPKTGRVCRRLALQVTPAASQGLDGCLRVARSLHRNISETSKQERLR